MNVKRNSQGKIPSTKKLDTQTRQEQIAQAALQLVARHGLANLSLARVADEVGLVPSALYRHYPNKDAIIQAILVLLGGRLLGNIRQVQDVTTDPVEQLHQLLLRHVALVQENRGIPLLIFSDDILNGQPERRGKVYQSIRRYLARVADILKQGQDQGFLRNDLDVETLSVMFLGLIQPVVILYHMSDGQFDGARQAEQAWRIFKEIIRQPEQKDT